MKVRVGLGQINSVVGGMRENVKKMLEVVEEAQRQGVQILAFPELSVCGYPPEDLVLRIDFLKANVEAVRELARSTATTDLVLIVGFVDFSNDVYNAAAIIHGGKIHAVYRKSILPNYGVFDEFRYFARGRKPLVIDLAGIRVGITICEDIWVPEGPMGAEVVAGNANLILNISASPFETGKPRMREEMAGVRARDYRVPVVYTNLVGGQDELVFDGHSFVVDHKGEVIARAKGFEEDLLVVDLHLEEAVLAKLHEPRRRQVEGFQECEIVNLKVEKNAPSDNVSNRIEILKGELEDTLDALILGVKDYVKKNGFKKVVLGLSGGIDSSLTASIATLALGPENVKGVLMPSRYSSKESVDDALELGKNLGIQTFVIPIEEAFQAYLKTLEEAFIGFPPDVTEENLQARIRGNILMALSNKFGWLVLAPGNKSEMSVGYATLYGDMAGGFAVIKDIYKTEVYKIGRIINARFPKPVIPENVFTKPPSAELRPGQTDQEKLPPYDVLDSILRMYIDEDKPIEYIIGEGYDEELVKSVIKMVKNSEYKRRQAAPGVKVSSRAFGKERRLPITNHYDPE